ncbi:MAG: lipid A export permease/ATP-binding protein MsbA [Bacteroidota bacterium]
MNSRQLYQRLLTQTRPYRLGFVTAVITMGLASATEPFFPAMMKELLDNGFSTAQGPWDWLIYPLIIIGIFMLRAVLGFVGDYLMNWVAHHIICDLRETMFARLVTLPVHYFHDNMSGHIISKVTYDVNNVASAATDALSSLIKDTLSIVGLLVWLMYLNWQLTLITLIMAPLIALAVRFFSRRLRRVLRGIQDSFGEITQVMQESVEGYKVIRIFGGQAYEKERFVQAIGAHRRLQMRAVLAGSGQKPIVQFFAGLPLAIIMGIAIYQAGAGHGSVGSFISFITAMIMLLTPLRHLTDVNTPIQRGLAAAESVFALIDQAPEADHGQHRLERARGEVEFENVVFSYPQADGPALQGISFRIQPGECIALVGQSGSGKTTVANLLPRFYPVDAGSIRIDGVPLEDITLESLRRNIALVSQEVVLFNDTIAANIAYGAMRHVDRAEIEAAARAAYADEFILQLPQGFDTEVGEHGVKLSGGQRQRLAIARALLKNAPILILDEATSALDTESERHVQKALDELMQGRTTLVIAHRLSTIEQADRILVLAGGRVVESASHEELLAQDSLYARLQRMQQLAE